MNFDDKINELNTNQVYPFHMPGHKRNICSEYDMYKIDITEIDGYDNLHAPKGMILNLENRISKLYGAYKSYVLVNGSTCGILSSIFACTEYGDNILMARNSHKSAYNALCIRGLYADYLYPDLIDETLMNDAISPDNVEAALEKAKKENRKYSAVYITSPTYEGIVSDILSISGICHKYETILIVDEAHGAHFGMHEKLPQSAIELGADVVIQSIHKTLTGMTQTALLHINNGKKINEQFVRKLEYYLRVFQTSSPSYVLMASVDKCVALLEERKKELFDEYITNIFNFRKKCNNLKNIKVFYTREKSYDCGKIVIYSPSMCITGKQIYNKLLEDYRIQSEMSLNRYCLAMTSIMDTKEGFERLYNALNEIDKELESQEKNIDTEQYNISKKTGFNKNEIVYNVGKAFNMSKEKKKMEENLIAGDYIYIYPPGIPFILPGEKITKSIICDIINYYRLGYEIHGADVNGNDVFMDIIK